MASAATVVGALAVLACAAPIARPGAGAPARRGDDGGTTIRVALSVGVPTARVSGSGAWRVYEGNGRGTLVRARGGEIWTVEQRGEQMRAVSPTGAATAWGDSPLLVQAAERGGLVVWNGRRYRGELALHASPRGVLVVNRLAMEEYLRGVVPLEIGRRTRAEQAAVEAQAVAARSYAYTHLRARNGPYDVMSTVADQVYGGADVETPLANAAVAATAGMVLRYDGRTANAPYHSTCGGSTAETQEVWHDTPPAPYLRRVSDRIPGSDRHYCDPSPRFRWTRTFTQPALAEALDRYLKGAGVRRVLAVEVAGETPSGRVGALVVTTDAGRHTLRANDIRYALRSPGGEILNSTYFKVETTADGDGRLSTLVLRGGGYGHGIGMCQWGAIGRARAGQDYRTILQTYYPGTTVGPVE